MCLHTFNLLEVSSIGFERIEVAVSVFVGIGIGSVLGTVIILIAVCAMKWKRDRAIKKKPTVQISSAADILQKYKQLADNGAITQEEYEAVKKRLLDI